MSASRSGRSPAPLRTLGIFAAAVALTFGGGAAIGAAIGPDQPSRARDAHDHAEDVDGPEAGTSDDPMADAPGTATADLSPLGLSVTRDGYTLVLAERELPAGHENELEFAITGPDGTPVTDFDVAHEKPLHLVIVGRDLVGYAHVHPALDDSGHWRVTVPPLDAGSYRVFADFVPRGGSNLVLGADLVVPGEYAPAASAEPSASATVDDYTVTVDGTLMAGADAELTVSVALDGEPLGDLDPYLGALGHLVAIREGDMAYLHVHPVDATDGPGGPSVTFGIDVPAAGTYRLFFDFSHESIVRTAAFTVEAAAAGDATPETTADGGHDGH